MPEASMLPKKTEKWQCTGCGFLLGFVEDKKIVRIKRKDLYAQMEGGKIQINCCRCGKINYLVDSPDTDVNLREGR
ncbi:MAG: flagellar biogenesis protein [Siphoviridae sp. ctCJE6]|nr:MAG: flagellar biogenesis protein [Siphoviridae sp. ctCJE6]